MKILIELDTEKDESLINMILAAGKPVPGENPETKIPTAVTPPNPTEIVADDVVSEAKLKGEITTKIREITEEAKAKLSAEEYKDLLARLRERVVATGANKVSEMNFDQLKALDLSGF